MAGDLQIEHSANVPIHEINQECTITQQIGTGPMDYPGCKDVYVFASGVVVVRRDDNDLVLHPAAGPIKITPIKNASKSDDDFNESEVI